MNDPTGEAGGTSLIKRIPGSVTEFVRTRAVAAVKHLVGAYVPGVLAASQAAKDERDAKSTIIAEVAKAAGQRAAANPEVTDRMLQRLFGDEIIKQENREVVVAGALEHLTEEDEGQPESQEPIEPDWLNLFGEYAQRATSETIQDLWSRVLAGEIRRPGTFSLITLQFISLLDETYAKCINKVLPWVLDGKTILKDCQKHGLVFDDLLLLEEIGFLSGAAGLISTTFNPRAALQGLIVTTAGDLAIVVDNGGKELVLGSFALSIAGRQLCSILKAEPAIDGLVEIFKSENPKRIQVGKVVRRVGSQFSAADLETKFERDPG